MAEYKIIRPCVFQGKRYLPNEVVSDSIITAKSIFGLVNMGLIEKAEPKKAEPKKAEKAEVKKDTKATK